MFAAGSATPPATPPDKQVKPHTNYNSLIYIQQVKPYL